MNITPSLPRAAWTGLLWLAVSSASAQSTTPGAAAPEASSGKKALIERVIQLQQGSVERLAVAMAEEPALVLSQRASEAIVARVPKERQEALAKDLQADMQKYVKDVVPTVRKAAVQLAPATVAPMLDAQMSESELREVIALLESPAFAKYMQLSVDMQKALQAKLLAATRGTVEPKVQALEKVLSDKIRAAAQAGAPAAPAAPAKPAATK